MNDQEYAEYTKLSKEHQQKFWKILSSRRNVLTWAAYYTSLILVLVGIGFLPPKLRDSNWTGLIFTAAMVAPALYFCYFLISFAQKSNKPLQKILGAKTKRIAAAKIASTTRIATAKVGKTKQSAANHKSYNQDEENVSRGLLFAACAIPIAMIVYLFLYYFGFFASLSSWLFGYLVVQFYTAGARAEAVKGFRRLIVLVVVGVVLFIQAGIAMDVLRYYAANQELMISQGYDRFWTVIAYLTNPKVYYIDNLQNILITIGFAALGLYSQIKNLHKNRKSILATTKKKAK